MWQDIIIMIACFGGSLALVPSIRGKNKPAKSSCVLTIIILVAIAVCFATLNLWLSLLATMSSIIAWAILLLQRR